MEGGGGSGAGMANNRVKTLHSEVEGVKNIMTQNVERILARGENLDHLRNKTEDLEATRRVNILAHARTGLAKGGENSLQHCQREAEEVTEIMMENYSKVMEREGKLTELDERADELRNQSVAFSKTTKTLAQKKWWENMKYKVILGAVVAGVVVVILLAIVLSLTLPGSGSQADSAQDRTGGN
ncbi:hypothetical protein JRQ81_011238 [Phrynocephalus forsythii]|uniref:V-SNARE coiled-coil homology domain-containing protein n=1 Tax=Phrynocephalus forsythii TaxID=171643 RepID=A0A9Q0X8L8_9SAUR|nr:hypothetical protein JRQ81_011238 [Phrynocephalus forsythii]